MLKSACYAYGPLASSRALSNTPRNLSKQSAVNAERLGGARVKSDGRVRKERSCVFYPRPVGFAPRVTIHSRVEEGHVRVGPVSCDVFLMSSTKWITAEPREWLIG